MASLGEIKVELNGEMGHEEPPRFVSPIEIGGGDPAREEKGCVSPAEDISSPGAVKANEDPLARSHSNPVGSRSGEATQVVPSKPAPLRGYGLKRRRRIRRDTNKDVISNVDSAQILGRRLSHAEPSKARDDNKHMSDGEGEGKGSAASLASMNIGGTPFLVAPTSLDPELDFLVTASGFSIGIDSENSDDHSSKSSTAASAPRLPYEAIGFGRDRSNTRIGGGKGSGHAVQQRGQRAKGGRINTGKKFRENRVKNEMENSYSSIESDLMSSNMAFVRVDSMGSYGKQSEKSINFDGEQSDDARLSGEVRSGFYIENGKVGDSSREDLYAHLSGEENNTKSENSQPGTDLDSFLESIVSLQSIKEALENEIQNIGGIAKDTISDDSDNQYEETEGTSSPSVEAKSAELNQKIGHLEGKLVEAVTNVNAKESKILELEAILKKKERECTNLSFLQEKCKVMEVELSNLLEKIIEAEIGYLVMTRTTQSWSVLAEDHISLLEEQRSPSGDPSKMMLMVNSAENKPMMLRRGAEELDKDISVTQEVLRLHGRVLKYSLCLSIETVILCIVFVLFIMQLLPSYNGVTPT
ncbi:WPP domain-interacting protein 1-like [Musa acuminata AAA Group]|uniref:WPP domain-interacting protein 1 n=1 Tax=Musa acuminata AAA Group TaxID=214697 RepID=UPI0031D56C47